MRNSRLRGCIRPEILLPGVWLLPRPSLHHDHRVSTRLTNMAATKYMDGFIKAEETARLKAVMLKARRYGYLPTDFLSLDDLLDSSDNSLFRSIR